MNIFSITKAAFPNDQPLSEFMVAYVEAALWATEGLENHNSSDLAKETIAKISADCAAFYGEHRTEIETAMVNRGTNTNAAMAGHDFLLTRNGHGAGFWDGDWEEGLAEKLTEAAKRAKSADLYLGDDGKIYQM